MTAKLSPKSLPLFLVDAFTSEQFAGNGAAIILVMFDEVISVPDELMLKIASEINLTETAFIQTLSAGRSFKKDDHFGLRWFSPTNEVDLCGHATLASAAALFRCVGNQNDVIKFDTLSGTLLARKDGEDIVLDMPLNPPVPEESEKFNDLLEAVVRKLKVCDVQYSATAKKLLIRLDDTVSRADLEALSPVAADLLALHDGSRVKGVIVTLKGSATNGCVDRDGVQYDFVSRYFTPWNGVPEDHVTGSAHTVLGPYWSDKLEKKRLYARQCSRRGGELRVLVREDGRVDVGGRAVVVIQGVINVRT